MPITDEEAAEMLGGAEEMEEGDDSVFASGSFFPTGPLPLQPPVL
jgi:hypothetical protein